MMHVIDWLLSKDKTIQRLTKIKLLNEKIPYDASGLITRYLSYYNKNLKRFSGFYTPKWTSSHYVLLELVDLEIDPKHDIFLEALIELKNHLWFNLGQVNRYRHQDLCVVSMLLKMCAYASVNDEDIYEMTDYILEHQMRDGGYNCQWETKETDKSSVHTTLSTLEAFYMYLNQGYTYRLDDVMLQMKAAEETLLKRDLFKSHQTGEPISHEFLDPHYPPRWKYDILRALYYFSTSNHPYDARMDEALNHLISLLKNGYMKKEKTIPGELYFQLEEEKYGAFNTLRMLEIIKVYRKDLYKEMMGAYYVD